MPYGSYELGNMTIHEALDSLGKIPSPLPGIQKVLGERINPPQTLDELVATVSTSEVMHMPTHRDSPPELLWEVNKTRPLREFTLEGVSFRNEGFAAINQGLAMGQLRKQGIITKYDVHPRPFSDYKR